jgi:metal-responsive CopG/Arc/MetJ family transcriptional regulator
MINEISIKRKKIRIKKQFFNEKVFIVSIKIPESLNRQIDIFCKKHQISKSQLIRDAIKLYLSHFD